MKRLIAEKIYNKTELLEALNHQRENILLGDDESANKIKYLDNNKFLIDSIKDDKPEWVEYLVKMFECNDGSIETKITLID